METDDWTAYVIAIRPNTESTMRIPCNPRMSDEVAEILVERELGQEGFLFAGFWMTREQLR